VTTLIGLYCLGDTFHNNEKVEMVFVSGCEWKDFISTATEFLNPLQNEKKCMSELGDYVQKQ
jgi:hypothetical protein